MIKFQIHSLFLSNLISSLYSGILVGLILSYFESLYLLFVVGNFIIDISSFAKAVLAYSALGGLFGILASVVFYFLIRKKIERQQENLSSFYFSLYIGIGFFLEIFIYLTDIYPYGGANKWSLKTLFLLAIAGILCLVIIPLIYHAHKKVFIRTKSNIFFRIFVSLIIFLFAFLSFMGFEQVNISVEKNKISGKKNLTHKNLPNVTLILVDALRPDHLACYGYPLSTSPQIDSLASQGVLFKSVLATSNWSVPTHASLFTGLYPSSHGAYSLFSVLGDQTPTLAEILSKNSYYSLSLYSNHLLDTVSGLNRGFDYALGVEHDRKTSYTLERIYEKFLKKTPLSKEITKITQKWIDHCATLKLPSFVFMNLFEVHAPYSPKEPYFSDLLTTIDTDKVNVDLVNQFRYLPSSRKEKLEMLSQFSQTDLEYLSRMYDSNIRYTDTLIGKLIENQKVRGRFTNTLNIITADHGEFLGEHGFVGHLTPKLYNPGVKIPLIMVYPEKLIPQVRDLFVSQVDIFPTVLTLLGLKEQIPRIIQGSDLFSEAENKDPIIEFWDDAKEKFIRATISKGYKLIAQGQSLELYHLESDPREKDNLAAEKQIEAEVIYRSMKARVESFKKFRPKIDNRKIKQLKELLKSLGYIN